MFRVALFLCELALLITKRKRWGTQDGGHALAFNRVNVKYIIMYRFCNCKFAYMLKFICSPKINSQVTLPVTHRHVQGGEKFELPEEHVEHIGVWQRMVNTLTVCFLVSAFILWTPILPVVFLVPCLNHFVLFVGNFCLVSSIEPKWCLAFLSARGCCVPYRENTGVR